MSSIFSRATAILVDVAPPPAPSRMPLHQTHTEPLISAPVIDARFHVEVVQDIVARNAANALLARCYAWRGYALDDAPLHYAVAKEVTLCAFSLADAAIGTVTVRMDGQSGLLCDDVYEDCTRIYRSNGDKLAEVCKLAVDASDIGMHVMGALFHSAQIIAAAHGANRVFIEVNPRHQALYRRGLGFEISGPQRECLRAGAPAVLLSMLTTQFALNIKSVGRANGATTSRGMFPYFFSDEVERQVTKRFAEIDAQITTSRAAEVAIDILIQSAPGHEAANQEFPAHVAA